MDKMTKEVPEKVILGRITGVYGVKGWLKIFSYTDPMEAIVDYSPWYIRAENRKHSTWTKVKLKAGKRHAKTVVAKLEHCNNRDEAMAYIGTEVAIDLRQLEELKEKNEFYWRDLVGLRVINQQDIELGVVKKLMETGANDVLVVVSEVDGTVVERLIPWTMDIAIIAVDIEQGVITVDWDADF
jgi:16S rRNA processing protein RimM